jgi:mannosyl-3-phosphoglycerate synthase
MPLAECLHYSSGYSIECNEFIDIFEKFGGVLPSAYPHAMDKGVEIFQIETRNPHFHEDKGAAHLTEMVEASLGVIERSAICPDELRKIILEQLGRKEEKNSRKALKKYHVMDPINTVDMAVFEKGVKEKADTLVKHGGLK